MHYGYNMLLPSFVASVRGETFRSLLVARYFLLVARFFLLVAQQEILRDFFGKSKQNVLHINCTKSLICE